MGYSEEEEKMNYRRRGRRTNKRAKRVKRNSSPKITTDESEYGFTDEDDDDTE